jgi:hypothetical protein
MVAGMVVVGKRCTRERQRYRHHGRGAQHESPHVDPYLLCGRSDAPAVVGWRC